MTVLGEALMREFARKHERAHKPLARFLRIARAAVWRKLMDVKTSFPATDYVADTYIFDIGGNKYRVLGTIDFEEQLLTVEAVLTHEQYNRFRVHL